MHYKNKLVAIVCSTALLGATLVSAEATGPGAAGFNAFGQTMQNVAPMAGQAASVYKDSMDAVNSMNSNSGATGISGYKNLPNPGIGVGLLNGFLKKKDTLTESELNSLKVYLDNYTNSVKGIMKDTTSTDKEKSEDMIDLNEEFGADIIDYVDEAKVEKFKVWVINMGDRPLIGQPQGNMPGKEPGKGLKKGILTQKTKDLFNKKLDSFPADKKEAVFTKLIAKIDLLISKAKSEKVKAQLTELKEMTQQKIDELKNMAGENDILDQIFDEGSTTGSGTDSTGSGTTGTGSASTTN